MRFVNNSGGFLELPTLDLRVAAGEEFDATGDAAKALLNSPLVERVDAPSKTSEKE